MQIPELLALNRRQILGLIVITTIAVGVLSHLTHLSRLDAFSTPTATRDDYRHSGGTSGGAGQNNTHTFLRIGSTDTNGTYKSAVRFNLAAIPTHAEVITGLEVYYAAPPLTGTGDSINIEARWAREPWWSTVPSNNFDNGNVVDDGRWFIPSTSLTGADSRLLTDVQDIAITVADVAEGGSPTTFEDQTAGAGLANPLEESYVHASAWGDVDDNGFVDLLVGTFVEGPATIPTQLFLNSNGTFTDAAQATIEVDGSASGAVFADLDSDGDLDLYISNYAKPGNPAPAKAEPSHLYRNDSGTFVDVTAGSGIDAQASRGRQVGAFDYDGDALLDLFIVGDYIGAGGPTVLLHNEGNMQFSDATVAAGLPADVHGLGFAAGDLTGNGWPDILVAGGPEFENPNVNYLFLANGDGSYRTGDPTVFDWTPFQVGVGRLNEDWVSSAAFGDLNRDGLQDVVMGHHFGTAVDSDVAPPIRVYMNRGLDGSGDPSFEDITVALGFPGTGDKAPHVGIQDFDNDGWPDIYASLTIDSGSGPQPLIFRNLGSGTGDPTFEIPVVANSHYYAGGPVADYDNDGRLDIFMNEWRSVLGEGNVPSVLFRNTTNGGNWLAVELNSLVTPMGIGAKVRVYSEGNAGDPTELIGMKEIQLGNGFSSAGPARAHFGLGDSATVDVVVEMPRNGGTSTILSVSANQQLEVLVGDPVFCNGSPATRIGTAGDDNLVGTSGDDVIVGLAGNDIIDGLGGDDVICGNEGDDIIFGGTGSDTIFGNQDDDIISGGNGTDLLEGNAGADIVFGGDKADTIKGGSSNDLLLGGRGEDMIVCGGGDDVADGGSHIDVVDGSCETVQDTRSSAGTTDASTDCKGRVPTHVGTDGDDLIVATAGEDVILGLGGNDIIIGLDTKDYICAGEGDDIVIAGGGADRVWGEDGQDVLVGGLGSDRLNGNAKSDYLLGENGSDKLKCGSGLDYADGGSGTNTFTSCELVP